MNPAVLGCKSCTRLQACCKNINLFPIPLLPEEAELFGDANVITTGPGESVIKPRNNGACPMLDPKHGRCRLGSDQPSFCKSYPIIYDGYKWMLDVACPSAGNMMYVAALLEESDEMQFFRRAVARLKQVATRDDTAFLEVCEYRTSGWAFPVVIEHVPEVKKRRRR